MKNSHYIQFTNSPLFRSLEVASINWDNKETLINFLHWNHNCWENPTNGLKNSGYITWFYSILNVWQHFIKSTDTVIDIGANVGDTTLPMAFLANEGKTIAFECGPSFVLLQGNKCVNPHLNIDIFNYAIAASTGEYDFVYSGDGYNGGMMNEKSLLGNWEQKFIGIRAVNLYEFLIGKYDISKIKFIKLDTEGSDLIILNSIKPLISSNRPILYIEWWITTEPEIRTFLSEFNYISVDPFTFKKVDIFPTNRCDDLILIPKERENEFLHIIHQ